MLAEHQLVLLGDDQGDPDSYDEKALAARPALKHFGDAAVSDNPLDVAQQAVTALDRDGASTVVHFDVDAVDSRDLPLANVPHYGTGVMLTAASAVLETLLTARSLSAVVLTEVNPTHDPGGTQLTRYIAAVTQALARSLNRRRDGDGAAERI